MAVINVLSKETVDQIAAGEVVERPASVAKELLENAVDAGASAITVEIKEGGITFLRVTDNGCGIEKSELHKAFLRHATSKIQSAQDLSNVLSLGFRGEALSSISAVSMLEMITKTKQELTAIRCLMEAGIEKELEEIGAPNGTTIIVRNLFFNTPVRKKFLKQPQTEGSYISDLMERMAMSHPSISFKYINNGQTKFHTSGNGALEENIYRIYGKEVSTSILPIDVEKNGIRMHGFLGKPEINRANRNFENYYVNGRYIKSDIISKGIEESYKKYMMHHKFPFVVLHFEINTQEIDVNVHPTKMEVRFINPASLFDFTFQEITNCLRQPELIPPVTFGTASPLEKMQERKEQQQAQQESILNNKKKPEPFESVRIQREQIKEQENIKQENIEQNMVCEQQNQLELFEDKLLTEQAKDSYCIMGQLFETYWLVAFKDKLYIVDQHAAHEKVKYEKFMNAVDKKQILSQNLFPPLIVTLSGREQDILKEHMSAFLNLGFEIEAFGGNEYAIRSVPTELYGLGESRLFTDMLDELWDGLAKARPDTVEIKIASMACKAAVKGNKKLSHAEMESLFDQLLLLEDPYHCPHGRPTIIAMTQYEIEKKFKRII